MKYIIATEDKNYWRWQMLVQINNFKKLKIDKDLIYVVAFKGKPSEEILKIQNETNVNIVLIQDEREHVVYTPSIRPHILAKFFYKFPEYGKCFLYLDPDVLFLKKVKWSEMTKDNVNYLSDTDSYISAEYIKSKSPKLLEEMCAIVGISVDKVSSYNGQSGGAQYLIKNIDYKFWQKVESDANKLYLHMENTKGIYNPQHAIQAWTSDMWAVLWNLWYLNRETKISKTLDFAWATDSYSTLKTKYIYHNAGITSEQDAFNKGQYSDKSPFSSDLSNVNINRAVYRYVEEIIDTKKNYSKLI